MDEHPHGTLGTAHHLADLAGGHLFHEPQHEHSATIIGQSPDGLPRTNSLVTIRDGGGRMSILYAKYLLRRLLEPIMPLRMKLRLWRYGLAQRFSRPTRQ